MKKLLIVTFLSVIFVVGLVAEEIKETQSGDKQSLKEITNRSLDVYLYKNYINTLEA